SLVHARQAQRGQFLQRFAQLFQATQQVGLQALQLLAVAPGQFAERGLFAIAGAALQLLADAFVLLLQAAPLGARLLQRQAGGGQLLAAGIAVRLRLLDLLAEQVAGVFGRQRAVGGG